MSFLRNYVCTKKLCSVIFIIWMFLFIIHFQSQLHSCHWNIPRLGTGAMLWWGKGLLVIEDDGTAHDPWTLEDDGPAHDPWTLEDDGPAHDPWTLYCRKSIVKVVGRSEGNRSPAVGFDIVQDRQECRVSWGCCWLILVSLYHFIYEGVPWGAAILNHE